MAITVGDVWQQAVKDLQEAGIENARLDARLLLEHGLGVAPHQLFDKMDNRLDLDVHQRLQELVGRRVAREPVSRIVGAREFWSLLFKVTSDTLDPRADSETLIETLTKYYPDRHTAFRVLDLGTGTGCLLLSILHEYKNASGVGVDISEATVAVAQHNARKLDLVERSYIKQGNWTDQVQDEFDVVISNPPYIASADIPALMKDVVDFDPTRALDGGADGLDAYRQLAQCVPDVLKPGGVLLLEIGQGQGADVQKIFAKTGLVFDQGVADLAGVERCLVFRKKD